MSMNVQKEQITAMKMPPAVTSLGALSVPAMVVLKEMASTVQVSFELLHEINSSMYVS